MTRAVEPPLLDDGAGQGSPSRRPLVPSDPWSNTWVPPTSRIVELRHDRVRRSQDSGRIPSQGTDLSIRLEDEPDIAESDGGHGSPSTPPPSDDDEESSEAGSPAESVESDTDVNDQRHPPAAPHLSVVETDHSGQDESIDDRVEVVMDEFDRTTDTPSRTAPPRAGSRFPTEGSLAPVVAPEPAPVVAPDEDPRSTPPPRSLDSPPGTATATKPGALFRTLFGLYSALVVTATAYWYYAVTTLVIAVAVPLVAGWHSTTVMTGSMEPYISPGDVVAVRGYDGDPVGVGTIIQFEDPVREGQTVTHRVVGTRSDGSLITKGDANATADSTPVAHDDVVGIATLVSPFAGLPRFWWSTGQLGWLALWGVGTALALVLMNIHGRIEGKARRRRWTRVGVAVGLVAGLAGVGTAAWSSASYAMTTSNDDNLFAAAATFDDFTHHGSIGIATCSNTTSTTLTLGTTVPAGRTVLIRFAMRNRQTSAPLGASDTKGNVYSVDADAVNGSRAQTAILSGHVTTQLVPGDQITVTHPRGRAVVVSFDEYSGITASSPVSASGTATGNSRFPSVTINVPDDDTLVIGSLAVRGRATVSPPSSGLWTALDGGEVNCSRRLTYAGAWLENNLASTVTFDPTLNRTRQWAVATVAYRSD